MFDHFESLLFVFVIALAVVISFRTAIQEDKSQKGAQPRDRQRR